MKKTLLLVGLFVLPGCMLPRAPAVIFEPTPAVIYRDMPRPVILPPPTGRLAPPQTLAAVCPDPTRGLVENQSTILFYKMWANPVFKGGKPEGNAYEVPPGAAIDVFLPPGDQKIYYESSYLTAHYGWQPGPRGTFRLVSGDARRAPYGCYGWRAIFTTAYGYDP